MSTINSVMTPEVVSIPRTASILQARALMKEKRIRHLPVIDEHEDVIGMLSSRDLRPFENMSSTVESLMSSPVESVRQNTPIRTAIFKMLEKKISCLLVSDDNDEAIGIVTTDDLLWYLSHLLANEDDLRRPLKSLFGLQTISGVTQQVSDMGI